MPDDPLRAWYRANRRSLLVREAREPWAVLVLEVMSQRTRIDRVGEAWRQFLERWPTPAALAVATTRDLLEAWAGLGYNRRALRLREAARSIVADHDGRVPADLATLDSLPGVGAYTARAVLASAFGVAVAPLDVNVRRVIARRTGLAPADPGLQSLADAAAWRDDPRGWVEAVMDLAVQVCRVRRPGCAACPVADDCVSRGTEGDAGSPRAREPFTSSRRWLRGEILRRVRAVAGDEWLTFAAPVGAHDQRAVHEALAGLDRDGFIERASHDGDTVRIRDA